MKRPLHRTLLENIYGIDQRYTLLKCIFAFVFLIFSTKLSAQIVVNTNSNAQQLIQTIVGPGFTPSNIKLNCPNGAIGLFSMPVTAVGLTNGILLTTGNVNISKGPNNSISAGMNNGAPGDADLDNLSGTTTYDACAIEFDLVPACDTLKIEYVFASEEYPEYVNKQFNDVFAFFISGPGITGIKNIATVPNSTIPVSINNINAGKNSQYFVNNNNGTAVQYDGFTKPLIAKTVVQPCSTYHLKLAIADVTDGIFDSGVYIKGSTIECAPLAYNDMATNTNSVENCAPGTFTFCRTGSLNQPFKVKYQIRGTATNGVDYVQIPDSVVIPANQKCSTVNVVPIDDNIPEAPESVEIIYQYGVCPKWDTIRLMLTDPVPFDAGPDVTLCSGDSVRLGISPIPGNAYTWIPATGISNSTLSNPWLKVTNNSNVDVTAKYVLRMTSTLTNCTMFDTVNVLIRARPTSNFTIQPIGVCLGTETDFLDLSTPLPGKTISKWHWNFGNGLFDTIQNPKIKYTTSGTFSVSLVAYDNFGCKDTSYRQAVVWASPTPDYTYTSSCQGDSIVFINKSTVSTGGTISQCIWNFGDNSPLINNCNPKHLFPNTASTFTVQLIVSSSQNCIKDIIQTVFIYPKPVANFTAAPVCIDDDMKFNNTSTGENNYWDFGDGTTSTLRNPTHKYATAGKHQVKLLCVNVYGCRDSIIKTVTVYTKPIFDFSASDTAGCPTICPIFTATTAPGSDSIIHWKWAFNTGEAKDGNPVSTCYDKPGYHSPLLIATSIHQCTDTVLKQFYIHVYPIPLANFIISPNEVSIYEPKVTITDASSLDVVKWDWDLGDGTFLSNITNITHSYKNAATYSVTLNVKNQYGCTANTNGMITVKSDNAVYIPNAFTPDGDGLNDRFLAYRSGDIYMNADYHMYIFDRWGLKLLFSGDVNEGWDGKYKGDICQQDVYIYIVVFKSKEDGGELTRMRGTVTLIK